jgi:rubrerythrin
MDMGGDSFRNMDAYQDMRGVADPDMPDDSSMDDDMRQFMAEGYIMGRSCFGSGSKQYADSLMEFINDEYSDHIYYQILSRRSPTANSRRIFKQMSDDELRHSKRFSAVYFLITGKRYFPTRSTLEPVIVPPVYIDALRQRYIAESRDAVKYRMFAQQVNDRCLQRIAMSTSDDEKRHAQEIMELIQSL